MINFANRHQVEEYLAEQAAGGVIVEIGGGYGHGAIALARGASPDVPIYVIDPYLPYHDELGSDYGPQTLEQFRANTQQANIASRIEHIRADALVVAQNWGKPVALLWLDLTMKFDRLWPIILAWLPHMAENSAIGITGLEYNHLGTGPAMLELERRGWRRELTEQRLVAVLRKGDDMHTRAVFYICNDGDNGRFIWEADRSASSVKEQLGLPVHLFLQGELKGRGQEVHYIDQIHKLPEPLGPFWYLDSTRHFNHAVAQLSEYSQLLYLDVDCWVCIPCLDVFDILDQFDMALGHSATRDSIAGAIGAPASFTTHQVGVNVFRNSPKVCQFLADWLALYEEHHAIYDDNDETPLRDALYQNKADLRVACLPPEYCLRFDFGAWVVGKVRILHGREGGDSRNNPADVAKEINSHTGMRIWHHGLLGN